MIKGIGRLVTVVLLFSLGACKYSNEWQTVNAGNKFMLSMPSWLEEDKSLKPGAELQYANRFRNFYTIGESLSPSDTSMHAIISSYVSHLTDTAIMKDALISDSSTISTGKLTGVRTEVFGKMDGETIYFSEVVLKGEKGFYHLSLWTRSEERKLHFKGQIDSIIDSFKEI